MDEEGFEYPCSDEHADEACSEEEDLAATQSAFDAARERLDDAISEHAEQGKRYGYAWSEEDEGVPPIDTISKFANKACGHSQYMNRLFDHGFPDGLTVIDLPLTHLTGPLVVYALHILGVVHSHLRDDIKKILLYIEEETPDVTEEVAEQFNKAVDSLTKEVFGPGTARNDDASMN